MKHGPKKTTFDMVLKFNGYLFKENRQQTPGTYPGYPKICQKEKDILHKQFQGSVGIFLDKKSSQFQLFGETTWLKPSIFLLSQMVSFLWFISPQAGPQMGPSIDVSEVAHGSK